MSNSTLLSYYFIMFFCGLFLNNEFNPVFSILTIRVEFIIYGPNLEKNLIFSMFITFQSFSQSGKLLDEDFSEFIYFGLNTGLIQKVEYTEY